MGSPCSVPTLSADRLFPAFRELGFERYEAFCSWTECRQEWTGDPAAARAEAARHGMRIVSYHLPPIRANETTEEGLEKTLRAARYAAKLGEGVIAIFKAAQPEIFSEVLGRFLDAVEKEELGIVTVVQNHLGSAIGTLDDYARVFDAVADPRLKAILEVGHFARAGISWREGWDFLGDRVALIHVNDIHEGVSVPYGTGEVDFEGLIAHIEKSGYAGDITVELELPTRDTDPELTLAYLAKAMPYLCEIQRRTTQS